MTLKTYKPTSQGIRHHISINKKELNNIHNYMLECINNPNIHKYIIDIFMEQILKILNKYNDTNIVEKIKSLDIKNFESSTKFLIYNIIENK